MHSNDRYKDAYETLLNKSSLNGMYAQEDRLNDAFDAIDFDPRFNSINWMFDCFQLVREIAHSYCWMTAYAAEVSMSQSERGFHVQYYADNCITRINSFRDKSALLAWSYYCPFNPHNRKEVLGYDEVLDRLQYPVRFGLTIKQQEVFVKQLKQLDESPFKRMKDYRDRKIHRIEPKILMRPPTSSDGLSYMVPLFKDKEIKQFERKLRKKYPDDHIRRDIEETCYIRGVLYDRIHIKDEYWHYADVEKAAQKCIYTCIEVATGLCKILRRRVLRK